MYELGHIVVALRERLKRLLCRHFWDDISTEPRTLEHAIANLYGDFVRCKHCSAQTYLTRQAYIDHLAATGRLCN